MRVILDNPKEVIVVPERKRTITEFNVVEMVDNPMRKIVEVTTEELGRIILWKDADYDAAGQWTDTDVANKLKQLYS
jgi:hypothetical protein